MFRNRLYYWLKPMLPGRVRLALRRWWTASKRKQVSNVWPIMPGSEQPPDGWKGWPAGKKFALVLTHDVEGKAGLERVRQLMQVEMELGFRSSFNFIPEGTYSVPRALREELVANGFEVGVHDFHHDGYLYHSREGFSKKAAGINRSLRDWSAVGFRSGFMFNQLEWLHDLDIAYDASTFDTDPFEPQPDGKHTIFPFWVSNPSANCAPTSDLRPPRSDSRPPTSDLRPPSSHPRRGYVELPYTLPQDSTLFLLLREHSPQIWLSKLDWIAEHGGMVLLDSHPDYMDFNGNSSNTQYPIRFYRELLETVRTKYSGMYWHVLPSELASYVRPN